jgi:hypothetical protein
MLKFDVANGKLFNPPAKITYETFCGKTNKRLKLPRVIEVSKTKLTVAF